jgi:prevent-host-death family protein
MRTTGVAELKATLSEHLARVKRGEEVLITERGRPIAKIVPFESTSLEEGVQELIRRGLARPPKELVTPEKLEEMLAKRPRDPDGSIRKALLEALRKDRDGE